MGDRAIFSASMVECAADGTNSALEVTRPKRVAFAADGLVLGPQRFPYSALAHVAVNGNVLSLALRDSNGRRLERHFRYDTFLPGTGVKRLAELVRRLDARNGSAPVDPKREPVVRAERLGDRSRFAVRVYGTGVSFPSSCPSCDRPATHAAALRVSTTLDSAMWIVPVCPEHPVLGPSVAVLGWTHRAAHLDFVFQRPAYGERFLRLNRGESRPTDSELRDALSQVNSGTRFVMFSYAISLVAVSFKRTSAVCAVAPGRSRVVAGLPYSLLSLLVGWWGLPHGPIFTISSLTTNLRGGIDLTSHLAEVIRGRRLPAVTS